MQRPLVRYAATAAVLFALAAAACVTYSYMYPSIPSIDVTSGTAEWRSEGHFVVAAPVMRANFAGSRGDVARLGFTYLGPTEVAVPLDSGELRRQLGLKLRSPNTCNVLYVMWRIEPAEGVVVSAKRNPGQVSHDQCGADGYTTIEPAYRRAPAPMAVGQPRALVAQLHERRLSVYIDDELVWRGDVPANLLAAEGLAGMRSDNVVFTALPSWW